MPKHHKSTTEQVETRYNAYAEQVLTNNTPLPFNEDGLAPQTKETVDKLAQRLYTAAELVTLPEPVVNASIGCGNPLALADAKEGEHVLDLGSGGGIDCFLAAKAVGSTGCVIGVDATPKMIELANESKAKMGVTNVEFRLGTIEAPPVTSATIDLIISNCVIDISAEKDAVFQEAYRVLKPGGRMAISDTVLLGEIDPRLKANIDQWAAAVITPLISLETFLQHIADAGFVEIRVDSLTSYGLESFAELDAESQATLTNGIPWIPLPQNTGLYSAAIWARKPA